MASITKATDGKYTVTISNVSIKSQKANNWSGLSTELPFKCYIDPGTVVDKGTATFTYNSAATTGNAWECTGVAN